MLTVVIDHPVRVDHALCAQVTRLLDQAGLRDQYAVEVSSPGPEPPLRVTSHYVAAIGRPVSVEALGLTNSSSSSPTLATSTVSGRSSSSAA